MNREEKREIRRVLMGKTLLAEDGRLIAMEKGELSIPLGITDGALGARLLGVGTTERRFSAACSEEKARDLAFAVMLELGRGLYLPQQPEAVACFIRYFLTRPAVLAFNYYEGVPVLTACTGRGITAWISRRRALNAFLKRLPKELTLVSEKAPDKKRKSRKKTGRFEKTSGPVEADDTEELQ